MANSEILVKGAFLKAIGEICNRGQGCTGTLVNGVQSFLSKLNDRSDTSRALLNLIASGGESRGKVDAAYVFRCTEKLLDIVWSDAGAIQSAIHPKASNTNKKNGKNKKNSTQVKNNSVVVKRKDNFPALQSIFNVFGDNTGVLKYCSITDDNTFLYPDGAVESIKAADYAKVLSNIYKAFTGLNFDKVTCNELLDILDNAMFGVPAGTKNDVSSDIALYVQTKMLAALSCSLEQYLEGISCQDYKEFYNSRKKHEADKTFMLISGDVSGIQDFIYNIPSKGALKSLRGRSFFLEIFMENFVDELLEELKLTRANLLYVGGGHFYIFAGNTEANKKALQQLHSKCNRWLMENFGSRLYMALGYAECSFEELMHCENQRSIFATVSRQLNQDKLNRYDAETLDALFDEDSVYNKHLISSRECAVCHTSSLKLKESHIVDGFVCDNCEFLYMLGERILSENCAFIVSPTEPSQGESSIAMFGRNERRYLYAIPETAINSTKKLIARVYAKNTYIRCDKPCVKILSADYCVKDEGEVKEFSALAESCCNGESGIKRIGVLRADVDNLGAAFIGGFAGSVNADSNLVRYANLSYGLALFFKKAVNDICKGILPSGCKPFSLYRQNKKNLQVHVVYSGGDDVFFVGAWDDLIELAVDIREAFRIYTNDKLTFSAGLAMFSPSFPISSMAEIAGELESCSKNVPGKDSISLFGVENEQLNADTELGCRHVYGWKEFQTCVCGEKLGFLMKYIDHEFIKLGTAQLYKFMELLSGTDGKDIKLARFAYALARLQPKNKEAVEEFNKFFSVLYSWYKDDRDRRQLFTAINLLVYFLRSSKED